MIKIKAYHLFWLVALLSLLMGVTQLNSEESTAVFNVHDTYFVVPYFAITIAVIYFLFGFGYWLFQKKLNRKLIKVFTIIHTTIFIISYAACWVTTIYYELNNDLLYDGLSILNLVIVVSFLLCLLATLMYIANIIIAIFEKPSAIR